MSGAQVSRPFRRGSSRASLASNDKCGGRTCRREKPLFRCVILDYYLWADHGTTLMQVDLATFKVIAREELDKIALRMPEIAAE